MLIHTLFFALGATLGAAIVLAIWLRDRVSRAAAVARAQAERDAAVHALADQRAALAESQTQLRDAFTALSRSALKENRDEFLLNADALLDPVREMLGRVQQHLTDVDKAREGSFQAVSSQLQSLNTVQEQLRSATEGLSRSLGSPNVRGTWGEVQLRRIVELAGMLEHCDFIEKQTVTSSSGGRQTPDLIVTLPGHATIVVDAKVPLDGYRAAANAADDGLREQHLALHVRQVRDHIRTLGNKEYWKQFQPAPSFVIMFLPLEPLLQTAFERDAGLFDLAAGLHVVPATPVTLLALLKTVATGWRQQQLEKNAEEIQLIGRELYERLSTMTGHLEEIGRNLKQAGGAYDRFVGSLEQKVLPGARRFKELGVASTKTLEPVEPLRLDVRSVVKPELTTGLDEDDDLRPRARDGR